METDPKLVHVFNAEIFGKGHIHHAKMKHEGVVHGRKLGIPSVKRLHDYGKSTCFSNTNLL